MYVLDQLKTLYKQICTDPESIQLTMNTIYKPGEISFIVNSRECVRICDLLWRTRVMSQWQVPHLVGINSAGHFYPIQSELSYLEVVEQPFSNCGLPWINYYKKSHMNAYEQLRVCFISGDVDVLIVHRLSGWMLWVYYWSYTVQVKSETSALRLVPCFARAGHIWRNHRMICVPYSKTRVVYITTC